MVTRPPKISLAKLIDMPAGSILTHFMQLASFGDVVQIPAFRKRYLINDPDSIQHILQTNADNYTKAGTGYDRLKIALGPGLLTNSGEVWAKQREDLQPLFFLKNLEQFMPVIQTYINATMDRWEILARQQQSFDIAAELLALVATISAAALFGTEISPQVNQLIKLVHIGNIYVAKSATMLRFAPTWRNIHFRFAQHKLDEMLLKAMTMNHHPQITEPLLGKIWEEYKNGLISKEDFLGDLKNFFVAGHETTGNALNWTIYLLLQNSACLEKLVHETDTHFPQQLNKFSDLQSLEYLDWVFSETLRLYPPIWFIERKALMSDIVKSYEIPAKSLIIISPYTMHRHPKYWQQPEIFIPERFNAEQSKDRPKCSYIPFGTGPRVCIGKQLALLTAKMILPNILRRFSLQLAFPQKIKPDALVTLKPHGKLWIKLKKRN